MNLRKAIDQRIASALSSAGADQADALTQASSRPEFGDYQANGCMAAAKRIKTNPRELATHVVEQLDLGSMVESVEIAGPGFLNVTLAKEFLAGELAKMTTDPLLNCDSGQSQTVVVDYSAPNLAKEMHVGHLRSTIIGDALARIMEFLGHRVIRQNHVGDWGTQFGMLLTYLRESGASSESLSDLETFYRQAKVRFDEDETFAEQSRNTVVALQSGDPECLAAWKQFVEISMGHCQAVYDRLGIGLSSKNIRGESAYNDDLPCVVSDLDTAGLLDQSDGARGVFLSEFTNKDNEPAFIIVQKSDGGYLYATTDLAAIRYRAGELAAQRVFYVTDSRQADHFERVFCVSAKAGFHDPSALSLEHVPFGMMLGKDRRPFKTRSGDTVKLMDLIDEAQNRCQTMLTERRQSELEAGREPSLAEADIETVAATVGIGALKYIDLSQNRSSDYIFAWDKMLSLDGNTAPYMQYAYARVQSIFRKGGGEAVAGGEFVLDQPAERALAVKLLQFAETIDAVSATALPNMLCNYLFELAGAFMSFYENCPVLKAESDALRTSRLALSGLTAKVLKTGLDLLGIETVERM